MSKDHAPKSSRKTRCGPVLNASSQPISLPLDGVASATASAEQNSPNTEESEVVDQVAAGSQPSAARGESEKKA